jgi:hypothetical protein
MDAPRKNRLAAILGIIAGVLGITAGIIGYVSEGEVKSSALFGGLFFLALGVSMWPRAPK